MSRHPTRLLLPTLALIALLFAPALGAAQPLAAAGRGAERAEFGPGLVSRLWDFLSTVWANGSGLEPDGANSAPGPEPDAATGDTGAGLDPNG